MLCRERRSIGNTPREVDHQHRGLHLQPEVHEHGAEMLLSGRILQNQPSDKVVNVDMEMTFLFHRLAVRDKCVFVRGCQ